MKSKELNVLVVIALAALLFIVFDCLTGKAGSLQPSAPPESTMVTLGDISAQIGALSSPVEKVVRGVITFEKWLGVELIQVFSPAVDPNRCVVLLGNAVVLNHESSPDDKWIARSGACLMELTETQIKVRVEEHPADQKVSYQIIEYK